MPRVELRRFFQHRLFMVGFFIILALVLVAVFAPYIAPRDPIETNFDNRLAEPGKEYLLGSDYLGRGILSRIIYGGRLTLLVAMTSMGLSSLFGVSLGISAGFFGGRVETIIMAVIDMMFAIPGILLALTITVLLGPSTRNLIIALAIRFIPSLCRVARGAVTNVKENMYVLSARAVGAPTRRILLRHILPNAAAPIIVQITLGLAWTILSEASLTFLGFGAQPPDPSWGAIMASGRKYMTTAPEMSIFPGIAIGISVMGFNFLGDGLRDILDPTLRNR